MANPSRVVLVVTRLGVGGAETSLVQLAVRLAQQGTVVSVMALEAGGAYCTYLEQKGVHVVHALRRWRYDLGPAREIGALLEAVRPEAVVAFGLYENLFVQRALRGCSVSPRVFVAVHGSVRPEMHKRLKQRVFGMALNPQLQAILVCESQLRDIVPLLRLSADQCVVLHNGVDTAQFDPAAFASHGERVRRALGIHRDGRIIAQIASFAPCKAHEVSIRSLALLSSRRPDLDPALLLIGDGDKRRMERLYALACRQGVESRIHFCGLQGDVRPFLAAADLLTLTSYTEALPISLLEGLSMGVPIVASRVGGVPEIVSSRRVGRLVEYGDALATSNSWAEVLDVPKPHWAAATRSYAKERFELAPLLDRYVEMLARGSG
jgi:glycosyltransferase involved in cell wall biosynthesis